MNNNPQAPPKTQLLCAAPGSSGKKIMLRPEEKIVTWMIDVVPKFFKAGELVLTTCAGTVVMRMLPCSCSSIAALTAVRRNPCVFLELLPSMMECLTLLTLNVGSD